MLVQVMAKICFIRRSFRFDGGAEVASGSYLKVLKQIADLTLICESWKGGGVDLPAVLKIKKKGFLRGSKYKNFITQADRAAKCEECITHSHEWLPGADVIRLGDGLHSEWLDIRGVSPWVRIFDGFHRTKINLEQNTIRHPNLKTVIVNSEFIGRSLVKRYGLEEEKIHLIRNIVTPSYKLHDPFSKTRDSQKLLFIGSGWERKGLSKAIMAFALLPKDWSFDVVGSDKAISRYKKMASELKCADRINFLGAFPSSPEIYAKATVLIHPAIYEPFPNVAIEALSQGLPVVSSINSGTSDFSQAEGVWTVEGDAHSLAESVLSAAKSSSENRAAFRSHILQFDAAYLEKELKAIYSNIMNT